MDLGFFDTFKGLEVLFETGNLDDLVIKIEIVMKQCDKKTFEEMKDYFPKLCKFIIEYNEKKIIP